MLLLGGTASSYCADGGVDLGRERQQRRGGVVTSVAVSGSTAYLGGNFDYVGPETGSFVGRRHDHERVASPWPAVGGNVYAAASDGAGGFFIGGQFSSIGTKHADNIAHIKSDGTLDTDLERRHERHRLRDPGRELESLRRRRVHDRRRRLARQPRRVRPDDRRGHRRASTPTRRATRRRSSPRCGSPARSSTSAAASLTLGDSARTNIGAVLLNGHAIAPGHPTTNGIVYALAVGGLRQRLRRRRLHGRQRRTPTARSWPAFNVARARCCQLGSRRRTARSTRSTCRPGHDRLRRRRVHRHRRRRLAAGSPRCRRPASATRRTGTRTSTARSSRSPPRATGRPCTSADRSTRVNTSVGARQRRGVRPAGTGTGRRASGRSSAARSTRSPSRGHEARPRRRVPHGRRRRRSHADAAAPLEPRGDQPDDGHGDELEPAHERRASRSSRSTARGSTRAASSPRSTCRAAPRSSRATGSRRST